MPNALWCTDFKGEFRLGDGRYCYPAMGSAVERAAEELLAWDTKGPRWTKAVQSCVDVFEGRVSPQEGREAFEAAAKEASVYLSPEYEVPWQLFGSSLRCS